MSKGRMQAGSCTAGMRREEVEALIRAANLGEEDSYIAAVPDRSGGAAGYRI